MENSAFCFVCVPFFLELACFMSVSYANRVHKVIKAFLEMMAVMVPKDRRVTRERREPQESLDYPLVS